MMTNASNAPVLGARAHDFAGATPRELFANIASPGFKTIQLAAPKSFSWGYPLTDAQCLNIQAALNDSGLTIAVLGCYVDVATPDDARNAQAIQVFSAALRTSAVLGARCVGTETTHFEGDAAARKTAFDRLTESVKRMAEVAEACGAVVGIEPVTAHVLNSPESAYDLLRRVNSERMRIIFDPSNLLRRGDIPNQKDFLTRCDQAFGDHVIAMHVKDAVILDDYQKPPRPLFEGELDWPLFLRWAKTKPSLPLLREEAIPARARGEIARMHEIIG